MQGRFVPRQEIPKEKVVLVVVLDEVKVLGRDHLRITRFVFLSCYGLWPEEYSPKQGYWC